MSMLDRRSRSERRSSAAQPVPTSTGPDEETVRIATKDFRRRRRALEWAGRRRTVLVSLALVLAVALVAAGAWVVLWSSYVTVRGVEVTGNAEVGRDRVERAAAVPTGTPLARVDLAAIRARVEAIPAVRRAEVSRSWPHRVHVAVTERVPVAVVNRGDGLEALDADGAVFGSYAARPRGLALVRTQPDTPAEALAEGGKVVGALPRSVASKLDTIEVDSIDKITLLLRNGKRVVWGSAEDSGQKGEVLAVLLRRPGQVIDVSVPGRPTTR
jgi:cell division protein FtsQ